MLGEIVCALNAETMQHFVSSLKVSVLQAQMMYVFERKNGGGGSQRERECVRIHLPIELVCSKGDLKPCPSDAGGFTTASVMSWQRAEGGDGGRGVWGGEGMEGGGGRGGYNGS